MKTSKKRDVLIWGVFLISGLLLFINNDFTIIEINAFDCKHWAYVLLSACAIFICYFINSKQACFSLFTGAIVLQALLIAEYYIENIALTILICLLAIIIFIILLLKYKDVQAIKVIDRQRLTEPEFSKINSYNLYTNSICIVGLLALLFGIDAGLWLRILVQILICFISGVLILIKQVYAKFNLSKRINILEYIFVFLWLNVTLLPAIISADTHKGLGYVALCIVVLMTDYFIFDRPFYIHKISENADK